MDRTRWSVWVTRWGTGQVIGKIPGAGMKFTDSLRQGGSITCDVPVDARFLSADPEDDYWRLVFWPCLNGQPMGSYVFLGHGWDGGPTYQVTGQRCDVVLRRRTIRSTLAFTQIDQNDIFRDLLRAAVSQPTLFSSPSVTQSWEVPSRIPWWRYGTAKSGVLRDRLETPGNTDSGYPGLARKIIGQMIQNLTELGDEPGTSTLPGPEYRLLYSLDAATNEPRVMWDIDYPTVGVKVSNPGRKSFEWPGGNISSIKAAGDGSAMGNRVAVLGGEVAGTRAVGDADKLVSDPVNALPYLEIVLSDQATELGTLEAKAAGGVAGAMKPNLGVNITVRGDRAPYLGTYLIGDAVKLKVRKGNRPTTVRDVRITGLDVQVDRTGNTETVTPTLALL